MKIADIQADYFRIPLTTVLSDSTHGEMSHFELITANVRSDDGVEGLGYTYTTGVGGTAIHAMIAKDLTPILFQVDARSIESIWNQMWWRLHWVGRGGTAAFAIAAVDIALWDLKAKRIGEPLWRMLGGSTNRVKAYAGGVDLQLTLDELCNQTNGFLDHGFRAIKMKVGREHLAEDVERVAKSRELIGPDIPLMVDANMVWSVDHAIRAAKALADYDIFWLEEPTIPDDIEGHAKIAREGGIPIAAGENLHTIYEFQKMISQGAVSFPEPDVATVGGVTPWLKIAHLAEAFNLPITTHGVHDLQVHLLAAVSNASYLEVHGFGLERFTKYPFLLENGEAVAPERPGHGVALDWEALESFREQK
ncbi:MAG: mandelate racemase/muconate lactonizing enzyme family protein [Desulfobacterales bacterium]|nr:MAG: mandelate racemase/muconate lactonizing enzyme family protein [Desulfobacterales bacterium]